MKHAKKFALTTFLVLLVALFSTVTAQAKGDRCNDGNLVTGYMDRDYCVPGLITNKTWFTPAPDLVMGKAVWYAPYLMEATAKWRGMDLTGFLGGVAMMSPADIGEVIWIQRPGHDWEGPFLVVDTSARYHMYTTIVNVGEVVEVDFATALRWGMVSGNQEKYTINEYMIRDVVVFKGQDGWKPEGGGGSVPTVYSEWFLERVKFTSVTNPNRLWTPESMKYTNYEEYQTALGTTSYLGAVVLSSDVVWLKRTNGEWIGPYSAKAVMELRVKLLGRLVNLSKPQVSEVAASSISVNEAHHYTQAYLQTVTVVNDVTWEVDCNDGNVYTGFTFQDHCVPGVISRESWLMDYPKHTIGVATYYAAGVMDRVVENRGMSLKGYVDGIVLMTCGNIGDSVWVRRPGTGWEGPYLVVDCGGPTGVWAFTQYRLHVEVDIDRWNLWQANGGTQQVEVCIGSKSCSGSPIYWGNYWLTRVKWLIPKIE